ncbi:GNAT family N-acetyltransferase [Novosphingobium aerophilum]|uniref:N-acetyltransferase n=1 Tax=Novosphingobium aerophilum TaxID=2839843 RepID=A0A7X1F4E1_9SPHN|nr:GNAT family N-acetyltransferase [Novosphingobium aerophilum]MBC2650192.1 N-acetyltransferase [Novosphingobium aerophilum]
MALTIRPAQPGDSAAIAAIYAVHVLTGTATFDTVPRTPAEITTRIAECRSRGWPFLVAEDAGQPVGYAYATQLRDRPAYAATCEDSIYVAADRTGQGIGSRLLAALCGAAEEAGFRQMIAVIGGGEPASVALHGRLGFRHVGRLHAVGHKFGRWLDTVYMQRALGEGNPLPPGPA